jgi:protein TonB
MGIFQDLVAYFAPKEDPHDPGLPFVDLADLKILSAPNPEDYYPVYSKHAGESGAVRLLLRIEPNGRVAQVKILRSSSFTRLDQAAASLSAQFLFEPYLQQDQACIFQTSVEVEFKS